LDRERVEAHLVFVYGGPGPVAKKALVPCHFIGAKGPKDFRSWLRARKLIHHLQPDILHFMENVVWLQAALLKTGYPKILHVHGPIVPSELRYQNRIIWSITGKIAQRHICITNGMRRILLDLGWTTPNKSSVVYNSINCRTFRNVMEKEQARSCLGLPQDPFLLGMVCRLVSNKGGLDFLSLLQRLPSQWHGVLCGDGPHRLELESLSRNLNLIDRLHFLGSQDDVRPVYAALDAYAFLTHNEPFGLVLAEAMAAEVPVFGLDGEGGYRETEYPLVTNDNAVLLPRTRPTKCKQSEVSEVLDELARRISEFGINPDFYRSMIHCASAWVNAKFDAPIQAQAMTMAYEQVLSQSKYVKTRFIKETLN